MRRVYSSQSNYVDRGIAFSIILFVVFVIAFCSYGSPLQAAVMNTSAVVIGWWTITAAVQGFCALMNRFTDTPQYEVTVEQIIGSSFLALLSFALYGLLWNLL